MTPTRHHAQRAHHGKCSRHPRDILGYVMAQLIGRRPLPYPAFAIFADKRGNQHLHPLRAGLTDDEVDTILDLGARLVYRSDA